MDEFNRYQMIETQKAWLAGFIDGEGYLGIYHKI